MLQIISYIRVEQTTINTNVNLPRGGIFYMTLFEEIEIHKGVEDLVQTARIKLPRRIIMNEYKNNQTKFRGMEIVPVQGNSLIFHGEVSNKVGEQKEGELLIIPDNDLYKNNYFTEYLSGTPDNISETTDRNVPIFQMGDIVTIWMGYLINDEKIKSTDRPPLRLHQQFKGYIASINAGEHIELMCEDFMWYFKQLRIPNIRYDLNENYNSQNHYYSKPITYTGKSSFYLDNSHDQTNGNNYLNILSNYPKDSKNPDSFSINDLQGVLYDLLNKTLNDKVLGSRGIYPLAWILDKHSIAKPAINFVGQGVQSTRNLTLENNATVFKFFEHLHESFGLNVYFWQQSPDYHTLIGDNNVPYSDIIKSESGWPGFYLNLGWDPYLPNKDVPVYQPNYYDIYLNGNEGNVISNNLTWVRADETPMGAIVKSTKQTKMDSAVKTTHGATKTKTQGSSVMVGDISGSVKTYLHSTNIPMNEKGKLIETPGDIGPNNLLKSGAIYDMAIYGYNRLNQDWYTGYHGTLRIFGLPFIYPGDIIHIHDKNYTERSGFYKIKKVSIKANTTEGLIQELHLHYSVNGNTGNVLYNYAPSNNGIYSNLNRAPVYYNDGTKDIQYFIDLNGTSK